MIHSISNIIEIIAVLGTASSLDYYLICLWSAVGFLQERKAAGGGARPTLPAVSILKPLKGTDPGMYESLRSHCLQDYPEYEIIFGVSDANDPAAEVVSRLQAEFPQRDIKLVLCSKNLGTNSKVSNLAQMRTEARYEYLLVNDSDIRVEPNYLQQVVPPLTNPKIASLLACIAASPARPWARGWNRWASARIFAPAYSPPAVSKGAFVSDSAPRWLSVRATWKRLADSNRWSIIFPTIMKSGKRISALGLEVKLSEIVVETFLPAYTLRAFLDHQLRWARCIRDSRRWGYTGLLLTFGLPWALFALIAAKGATWACFLLGITAGIRLAMSLVIGRDVLQDRQVARWLWLVPLRDFVGLFVWFASFAGHTVSWRGDRFTLKDGRLSRVAS